MMETVKNPQVCVKCILSIPKTGYYYDVFCLHGSLLLQQRRWGYTSFN